MASEDREVSLYHEVRLKKPEDIRILHIHTAEDPDEPIKCSLEAVSLADSPAYTTLSYAWGETYLDNSHLNTTITCNDITLRITTSLHGALRAVRRHLASGALREQQCDLPIWADGVCIDQSDHWERAAQVALMGRIYSNSQRLFVWLGELDKPRHLAITPELQPVFQSLHTRGSAGSYPDSVRKVAARNAYRRAWFYRRWVIQEYMQSTDVNFLLGPYLLSLKAFRAICASITLPQLLREFRIRTPRTLIELFIRHSFSQCSDPRDRVYSLVGLSKDGGLVNVDYSIDADTVFLRTTKRLIETGNAATMLVRATCSVQSPTLPSWVSDFGPGDYKSQDHWEAASHSQSKKNLWGGLNIDQHLSIQDRRLQVQVYVFRPCSANYDHDQDSCPLCASSAVVENMQTGIRSRYSRFTRNPDDFTDLRVFIFPPDATELDHKERKVVFVARPAKTHVRNVERSTKDPSPTPEKVGKRTHDHGDEGVASKKIKQGLPGDTGVVSVSAPLKGSEVEPYELVACAYAKFDLRSLARRLDEVNSMGEVSNEENAQNADLERLHKAYRGTIWIV